MSDPLESLLVRFTPPGGGDALTVPAPADLRFDVQYPGGFKSLSCSLALPVSAGSPEALRVLATVTVVDRRTGRVVWYGELTDPGLQVSADALQFAVTCEGMQSRADGWREVYALVDRSQDSWQQVGEFDASQGSFGGDLSPPDFDLPDIPLDDFDGELDGGFDGDIFPITADYPGYLGYLQDPNGGLGDMLPIPLNGPTPDGSWWDTWEPGFSMPGSAATGTTSGTATVGAGGGLGRHRKASYGGKLISETATNNITVVFRLDTAGAVLRLWGWTESDLTYQGYYLEVTTSSVAIWRVDNGSAVQLATASASVTVGVTTTVEFDLWPDGYPTDTGDWTLHGAITGAGSGTVDYIAAGSTPYIGGTDLWWGVSVTGSTGDSVTIDSALIVGLD